MNREPWVVQSVLREEACLSCGAKRYRIDGRWVRHLREKRDLTLRAAAKKMGISPAYLSDIELNRRSCPRSVAEFFKIDESNLRKAGLYD